MDFAGSIRVARPDGVTTTAAAADTSSVTKYQWGIATTAIIVKPRNTAGFRIVIINASRNSFTTTVNHVQTGQYCYSGEEVHTSSGMASSRVGFEAMPIVIIERTITVRIDFDFIKGLRDLWGMPGQYSVMV